MEPLKRRDPYRLVGTTLDRYQILELVGSGGMGAVYRARHGRIGDIVALKILKPDLANESPKTRKKLEALFLEEARHTRLLDHPNIVRVADAGISEDITFLVMEWLEGHTLQAELQEAKRLPSHRVATLLEQICEGMDHAHKKGLVHRDLKPGNIMIVHNEGGQEAVKIVDFGIAKALNSVNSRVIGAPYYASPEQLNVGLPIDQRSDVYSLGVMIYELLTGKLPFDADSIGTVVNQHLSMSPPLLREIQPEISEAVEDMVLRALAKRPDDRYQNVNELARAFRQAANLEAGGIILHCLDASNGSNLAKASIYLNGKYAGTTNDQGKWQRANLLPRDYSMDIDCHQYLGWKTRVRISPREQVVVEAKLEIRKAGALSIRTMVAGSGVPLAGAEVMLSGKLTGTTDKIGLLHLSNLSPGKFEVEVRHSRRKHVFASDVEVVHDREAHFDVEFPHEGKVPMRVNGARLRWILISAGLIVLAIAAITAYRFKVRSGQTDELLNRIAQADQYNDAGIKSYETARSLAALAANQSGATDANTRQSYESAVTYFKQALGLDPGRDDSYYNLGLSSLFLQDFEQAETAFKKATELNTANQEYRLASEALGKMLLNWQKRESGGPAYLHSSGPNLALYYFERGNLFLAKKDSSGRPSYQCAEFEYRQAGELDNQNPEFYYMRGVCLDSQLNYTDAIPMFERALALDAEGEKYSNWKKDFSAVPWPEPKADEFRDYRRGPCQW